MYIIYEEHILLSFRILHDNGFSDEEIAQQRAVIYSNASSCMATMLKAMEKLEIQLEDPEREASSIFLN